MRVLVVIVLMFTSGFGFASTYQPTNARTVMPYLNAGWGPSFNRLAAKLNNNRNYVTWILHSPSFVMDLRSANHFQQSVMSDLDKAKSGGISHMMVAWQCHTRNGQRLRGATGFTGEGSSQTRKMIMDGWGLSSLFAVFYDAELNSSASVEDNIQRYFQKRMELSHITFEVSQSDCLNMLSWLEKWISHPKEPGTRFGLNLDVRKYQGGGCGNFASALLEKAGVLPSVQRRLDRTVRGTTYLMGGGLPLPPRTAMGLPSSIANRYRKVSLDELQRYQWGDPNGYPLTLTDPELGLLAMRTIATEYYKSIGHDPKLLNETGFRQRHIRTRIQTVDRNGKRSLRQARILYNEKLDSQARDVYLKTRKELHKLSKKGYRIQPIYLSSYWGLLISK